MNESSEINTKVRVGPRLVLVVVFAICLGVVILLFIPTTATIREAKRRSDCANKMNAIAKAFESYRDQHGDYPPPFSVDDKGQPLLSWRVLILPFLGEEDLYSEFDLTKPWNDKENAELLDQRPDIFDCPSHGRHDVDLGDDISNYVLIQITNQERNGKTNQGMPEGARWVIACVNRESVSWTAPDDISLEKFLRSFSDDGEGPYINGSNHPAGVMIVAQGYSVQVFPRSLDRDQIRAWILGEKSIDQIDY